MLIKFPIKDSEIKRLRVEFSWQNSTSIEIPNDCFDEFTLQQEFGDIQIIYCQVGRHLNELYYAQDQEVLVKHIQPHRFFSANTGMHFGPDIDPELEDKLNQNIYLWFKKNENKFNQAGVFWNNKNKALGSVRVAELIGKPTTLIEIKQFQLQLSNFDRVSDIILS